MKNLRQFILALLLCCTSVMAWAYDFEVDGIYYNITSDAEPYTVEVTSSWYYYGAIVIPENVTYNGTTYSVTTIRDGAFSGCTGLTSITIPNSVTTIEKEAFTGCTNLVTIDVNAENMKYKSIDGVLFNHAADTLIQYPYGRQGAYAIPNSVTTIGEVAFRLCTGLTSVTIPNSVTTIGVGALGGCSNLVSVTIPNSVTTIGHEAFSGCTGLSFITIPNSVIKIGVEAFEECTNLISVTIGNSVTTIGEYAFGYCTSLVSVISLLDTPPTLENDVFEDTNSDIKLIVCCGSKEAYETSSWNYWFNKIEENCDTYSINAFNTTHSTGGSISVSVNQAKMGDNVEVLVALENGYTVGSIKAYNANNPSQELPISLANAKSTLTYSFIMMPFPVKVEATLVKGSAGIGENKITTTIYPNPTSGTITIEAENLRRVSMFNTLGQKVYETTASGNSMECNLSGCGTGVYLMQIETANGIATKRIVVE